MAISLRQEVLRSISFFHSSSLNATLIPTAKVTTESCSFSLITVQTINLHLSEHMLPTVTFNARQQQIALILHNLLNRKLPFINMLPATGHCVHSITVNRMMPNFGSHNINCVVKEKCKPTHGGSFVGCVTITLILSTEDTARSWCQKMLTQQF